MKELIMPHAPDTPAAAEPAHQVTIETLEKAFERAGMDIQRVGKGEGKLMTMGSVDLSDLVKVFDELGRLTAAQSVGATATPALRSIDHDDFWVRVAEVNQASPGADCQAKRKNLVTYVNGWFGFDGATTPAASAKARGARSKQAITPPRKS
jgi:hypothetical protein